jgi:hypothetical protein
MHKFLLLVSLLLSSHAFAGIGVDMDGGIFFIPPREPENLTFTAQVGCSYVLGGGTQSSTLGTMKPGSSSYVQILGDNDAYIITIQQTGNLAVGGNSPVIIGKHYTVSATRIDLSAWNLGRKVWIVGSSQAVGTVSLSQNDHSQDIIVETQTLGADGKMATNRTIAQHQPDGTVPFTLTASYGIRRGRFNLFQTGRATFTVNLQIKPWWERST